MTEPALKAERKTNRRVELDSLRGLAALSVVFCHFLNVFPQVLDARPGVPLVRLIRDTPLHFFWAGTEAVVVFFVLSGFVLSLPFYTRPPAFKSFLIRRICRIWLPYLVGVAFAFLAYSLFRPSEMPLISSWYNKVWRDPITPRAILDHALLIVSFKNGAFDPVLWSLVMEMRISILFPLLMWAVLRMGFRFTFVASLACYVVGRFMVYYTNKRLGIPNDYFDTLMYLYMFVVGAYMARNIDALSLRFRQLTVWGRYGLLAAAIVMYTNHAWLPQLPHGAAVVRAAGQFFVTAAAAIFVLIVSASGKANSRLTRGPVVFLGKISYSLYLVHAIVLMALVSSLYGAVPLGFIHLMALAGAFVLASVMYYAVEEPSMALGKWLTSVKRAPSPAPVTPGPPAAPPV